MYTLDNGQFRPSPEAVRGNPTVDEIVVAWTSVAGERYHYIVLKKIEVKDETGSQADQSRRVNVLISFDLPDPAEEFLYSIALHLYVRIQIKSGV